MSKAIAEQRNRLGVWDGAAFGKTEKLQEAVAIQQLILERIVSQIVELLQDQYLGHQDGRVRQTATLGTRRARQGDIDLVSQCAKINVLAQADKGIAQLRTSVSAFFLGKQARLGHHHRAGSWFMPISEFYRRRRETGGGF